MEGTKLMMSLYEAKTAKKVYLYRNGASHSQPKCLVVNDRQVRDFSTFLNRVTSGLKAPVAIRNIYTPSGGHRVKNLNDLRSGHYYVAGGAEHFKKVKYGDSPPKLLPRRPLRAELIVPPRTHQAVVASARYKKPVEKPFVIHVFRNGDERYRGARVLLTRRIMGSWDHVLEIVAEKVNLFTPVKRLCTLDGRTLHAVSELQDGGKYVAIEGTRAFQRVSYCATEERKLLRHTTLPRMAVRLRRRAADKAHLTDTEQDSGSLSDSNKTPFLTMSLQRRALQRRASRPMAGRKNKEARVKAIEDHRADSIFGGSPTGQLPSSPPSPRPPAAVAPQSLTGRQPPSHPLNQSQTTKSTAATVLETTHATKASVSPELERKSQTGEVAKKEEEEDLVSSEGSSTSKRTGGLFHAKENNAPIPKQPSQEYSDESQGDTLFKAKAESTEAEEAEVVIESGDTEVEKPVDLEEAEEIADEESNEKLEEPQTEQTTHDVELKTQPLQTSIDLSLNRNPLEDATRPPPVESQPTTTAKESTPEPTQHSPQPNETTSSVKIDDTTESIPEEVMEQSRTHSVLSKREEEERTTKGDDDVPEEIPDGPVDEEIEEAIVDEEVKGTEEKKSETPGNNEQESVAEEVEEQEGDSAVPGEPLNESEQPVEEEPTTQQHTNEDAPNTQAQTEEVEEIKEEDTKPDDTPPEAIEEVTEEVTEDLDNKDTSSQDGRKDSTVSQPENSDTAAFVIEDPVS